METMSMMYVTFIMNFKPSSISDMIRYRESYPKADPAPARRARVPLFVTFYECILGLSDSITRINFIVINMQCVQYVFYSLRSLLNNRVCVKGLQKNLQTSRIIPRRDRTPRFLNFWIRHCYRHVHI